MGGICYAQYLFIFISVFYVSFRILIIKLKCVCFEIAIYPPLSSYVRLSGRSLYFLLTQCYAEFS